MGILKYLLIGLYVIVNILSQPAFARDKIIAFAQDEMKNDFRRAQVFEVRDELRKHPGLRFIYSDARGKTALLIRQIEKFISQRVDVLIISTNDENAVVPVVSKAYHSGIPVIILERGVNTTEYTSYITSDNRKVGQIAAEFIAAKLQNKGTILLFEGIKNVDVTKLRTLGFMEEIKKYKNIKVIKRTANFLRKEAVIEMEKLFTEGIQFDAIFSESDSMLSGVRLVFNKYNISPSSIIMVGVDFISEAQQAIRKGQQTATVLYPLCGIKAVEVAVKILANEKVDKKILIPGELVTIHNVEQVKPIF